MRTPRDIDTNPFAASFWAQSGGPILAVLSIAAVEVAGLRHLKVPNPTAILMTIIVFAAFTGGVRSGLITAGVACLCFGHLWSMEFPSQFSWAAFLRVVVFAFTTPAIVLMAGVAKRRADRMMVEHFDGFLQSPAHTTSGWMEPAIRTVCAAKRYRCKPRSWL